MKKKISRNAPCPCGSGKKSKKCCGVHDTISITHVLEREIDDLQKQLLFYSMQNYSAEIGNSFHDFQKELIAYNEQEGQFFELIQTIWYTLFHKRADGKTILQQFIDSEHRKIKRPKLKQILLSWENSRVIAGKMLKQDDNQFVVLDGLTSEELEAVVVTKMDHPYEEGVFFTGFLLPYEQKHVFFPVPFDFAGITLEQAVSYIMEASQKANYESPQQFLTDYFTQTMYEIPLAVTKVDVAELEWPAPVYQEVAEVFQEKLNSLGETADVIETGVMLWFEFCQSKQKRIQNPSLYAAALHYFVSTCVHTDAKITQKEIAEQYGVSARSMSSVYRDLADVLSKEFADALAKMQDKEKGMMEAAADREEAKGNLRVIK